ncbi:MAG: LacI family DNA-binding transcriptional regulator [Terriglobia bacterium]
MKPANRLQPPPRKRLIKGRATRAARHVTIRDVARIAGASVSTVSAAINNTDYVSAAMRLRIQRAIARLGYRPNDLARGLRLQRTHTLGVVVPDLSNSFYTEVLQGMKDYASAAHYTLLIGDSRDRWAEEQVYLDTFHRRRVDGVIRIPAVDEKSGNLRDLLGDIPVVYADRFAHDAAAGHVGVDNVVAAFDATRYLMSLGHRRIGIIAGPETAPTAADRLEGYRRALRSGRVHVDGTLVRRGDNGMVSGHREAIELLTLPNRPTAIFCTNNMMTLGAFQAIQELKTLCPEEVSLVGFDDFYWAPLLRPQITMVRQPAREIGMAAARLLIEQIEGRIATGSAQTLSTQLIVRQSCAPPAARSGASTVRPGQAKP